MLIFLGGCANKPTSKPKPACHIIQDKTSKPLRGSLCIDLIGPLTYVELYLVNKIVHAHDSRIVWNVDKYSELVKSLQKPLKEEE